MDRRFALETQGNPLQTTHCDHCGSSVLPTAEGHCPRCRQPLGPTGGSTSATPPVPAPNAATDPAAPPGGPLAAPAAGASKFDRVLRWGVLVLAVAASGMYSVAVFTEWSRLTRDIWEDGIVLGFCYAWMTLLGALRSVWSRAPDGFLVIGALANVAVGYVLVMLWVALFAGEIDRGAEFMPPLLTVIYLFIRRAIRVRECFRPWSLVTVLAYSIAAANFAVPEYLGRRARGLEDLSQVATIAGALQWATVIIWIGYLIAGFSRGRRRSE